MTAHEYLDSTDKPFKSVDILFYKSIKFIPKQSDRAFVYPKSSICFTLFTLQGSVNSKPYHLQDFFFLSSIKNLCYFVYLTL